MKIQFKNEKDAEVFIELCKVIAKVSEDIEKLKII